MRLRRFLGLCAFAGACAGCSGMGVAVHSGAACEQRSVTTLTGNGIQGYQDGTGGTDGTTMLYDPRGVAVDPDGFAYVMEGGNQRIRRIAPDGSTTTLTGNGSVGFSNGTGGPTGTTSFAYPVGLARDTAGNLYVGDTFNNVIRIVAPNGSSTTFAGTGAAGFKDGPTPTALFNLPQFTAVDTAGNVYVTDLGNNRVRKITPGGTASTLSGDGVAGFADGTGGPGGTARFNRPNGIAVDGSGFVYVADELNHRIRKIAPDGTTTTLAGDGTDGFVDGPGGKQGTAEFSVPNGLALDDAGNLYVTDGWDATFGLQSHAIRKVAPDGTTTTIAGGATSGFADGTACDALFEKPSALAVAGKVLLVTDGNNRVRQISLP